MACSSYLQRPIRDIDDLIAECRQEIETARTAAEAKKADVQLKRLLRIKADMRKATDV